MVKGQVVKVIECDMCHTANNNYVRNKININNHDIDLCNPCKDRLQQALTLLTIVIGYDIKYRWDKDDSHP